MIDEEWNHCDVRCYCGDANVVYRCVEDDEGHLDEEYHCHSCGRNWWIEGVDS